MRSLRQVARIVRVLRRARRNRTDLLRALARRPLLLLGTAGYEFGTELSARVDPHLKLLAGLKAAALVHCEFCIDIGSALARDGGVREEQLRSLHRYDTSDAFDADERLVLDVAVALTRTPALVPPDLRARLEQRFTPAERAELLSAISWENHRARLNQGLGVRPSGFSDGAVCALPEPAADDDARGAVRRMP